MAQTQTTKPSHLLVPVALLAVVLMMVVPLPPMLLDLLLSVDIGMAVVLLLTSIYVKSPVEFSVFPSLLLLLTMIRLSLNIASTRLVLLHGGDGTEAAGSVIQAFGQFVVGGNFVVGVVIFLVLIAVQYIVINHGAVRISEVTARFTLDAMPGRQMAIDADLNAGVIDEKEARDRRSRIRREADFYGAMDGAIRFTQRDALAAVLITFVNIVAGLIIGVVQHGLDLGTAAETYTILTVGEGLVTAIPALLVSMAGGLITTRAAAEAHLGEEVATQLFARSRPLLVAAGLLVILAAIPGLPKLSFLIVAALLSLAAYAVREVDAPQAEAADAPAAPAVDAEAPTVGVEPLSVEVGYALVGLVDEKQGGTLLSRVRAIRRQIATETGVIVPPVRIADNLQLGPRGYTILVKGVEVARGELYADRLLAINPGTASRTLEGVQTREPAFGLPALWVNTDQRDTATSAGYTVVDATTALSTHLSETIRTFLPDLLSRQQTKEMLDQLSAQSPKLVEDLVPKVVGVGEVQRVLRQLLRERVPVRDLATILESLADAASATKDPDSVVESVRASIGRAICRPYQNDKGELPVIGVLPGLEEKLLASIVRTEQGAVLALDPQQAQSMASKIARAIEQAMAQPVLLCSPALRPHLWRLFARVLPHLGVLSHSEVPPHVPIVPLATLD
ncbi:MAG TPA: flagellar biosynthesis protein FlhA [Vicinamibacterales bacterium]|nr:flagellar biosynthesis protein FlhA [Vicinamibacterales bacterium]